MPLNQGVLTSSIGHVAKGRKKKKEKAPDTIETNNELFFLFFLNFLIQDWETSTISPAGRKVEEYMCILSEVSIFPWLSKCHWNPCPPPLQTLQFYTPLMYLSLLALQICGLLPLTYLPIGLAPASIYIQMLSICHIQSVSKYTWYSSFSFSPEKR